MDYVVVDKQYAQGDVMFIKRNDLPAGLKEQGNLIVTHSETGHHHVLEHEVKAPPPKIFVKDDFVSYIQVFGSHADVVHKRSFDTHKTLRLGKGVWEVRRQREYTPSGFRRVED